MRNNSATSRASWRVQFCAALALAGTLGSAVDGRAQTPISSRIYASGFSFPVAFVPDPVDRTVQYVVEQRGRIRVVRNEVVLPADFLDLSAVVSTGGEQGLLGLAFAPDYATSGRFFVNFTNAAGHTVIARFRRSSDPLVADTSSRFDLVWSGVPFIAQPFSNHNGGNLAFGPDGYLYIGLGDGGSGNDPDHRAQDPAELLGKMLRIDVSVPDGHPTGYEVPPTNPFIGAGPAGTRPEIWSFGFRNPWRYSFDDPARGGTGALLIGDVGQSSFEEINYEPANRGGRNYGWRNREGAHDHILSPGPAFTPLVDPIYEYGRTLGVSVTGGFVYRGWALGASYRGRYFFGDYSGRVWSLALAVDPITGEAQASDVVEHTAELGASEFGGVTSFGLDADGELYIVGYVSGTIRRVLGATARAVPGDYDGDGNADRAVLRPSSGMWSVPLSSTNPTTFLARAWGTSSDVPVPGDYDGDGKTDLAIYRPSNGLWAVLLSSSSFSTYVTYTWGVNTDTPTPADYDGDGKTDLAIYRPANGLWAVRLSTTNYSTYVTYIWGAPSDTPVPADYDGDSKADVAVFRPSTGDWVVLLSTTNASTYVIHRWGASGDTPVPADYDADSKVDFAIYRPSQGLWAALLSSTNHSTYVTQQLGISTDMPVPADYDGDGDADFAIYRAATDAWWLQP